jgi:hypothetical protein
MLEYTNKNKEYYSKIRFSSYLYSYTNYSFFNKERFILKKKVLIHKRDKVNLRDYFFYVFPMKRDKRLAWLNNLTSMFNYLT